MLKYSRYALVAVMLAFIADGCKKDDFRIEGNVLDLEKRSAVPFERGKELQVDQMQPDDVIVAVNGYPITKRVYDIMIALKAKSLESDPSTQAAAMEILKNYRMKYFKTFIGQRLLVDNAIQLGLVTTNEVNQHVEKYVIEAARRQRKSVKDFLKEFHGCEKFFFYEQGVAYAMDKVISAKIPPLCEVNEAFVSNVMEYVEQQNALAATTNRLRRVEFKSIIDRIATGELSLSDATNGLVHIPAADMVVEDDGAWGEFAEDDLDDGKFASAVFALPEGGFSEILEDDDGFTAVKVCSIIPPEKDDSGAILVPEKRKLSRIYAEKLPMNIQESEVAWTINLKHQMQAQAINRYVLGLSTNGFNRIEYPHGRILFK